MKALQDGEAGDSLRRSFTQDVRQIEMPNQLNPRGQESGLEQILQRTDSTPLVVLQNEGSGEAEGHD
jgi:hypothetical protein